MAKASTFDSSLDFCITCSSKHARIQPALCQCKHCSNSFCFDCMKEHNDELQQNTAHVSNRCNELKLLINNKRKLITEETMKSKVQMSEWLQKYIDNLIAEKAKIDMDIDKAEQDAQRLVRDIEVQLQTISSDIEAFTKTSIYQSEKMDRINKILDELIERIFPLTERREYDLPSTMPKYKFEFEYSCKSTINEVPQTSKPTEEPKVEKQNRPDLPASDAKSYSNEDSSSSLPDENYFLNRERQEPTSFIVNCMASDGTNIMYSSNNDVARDIIAYFYLDVNSAYYGQDDPHRLWLLPRIVDMIWWKSIGKFVCATNKKILTVEHIKKHFKILSMINNLWTDVRVAANTNSLWVHDKEKIMVYNVNFVLIKSIDFEIPCIITRQSFCITDKILAFLVIRGDQTSSNILQIRFYDFNMIRIRSFDIGSNTVPCMVRTDGEDKFFIAGGKKEFHIISWKGGKRIMALEDEANCLAVVNSRNIVFTNARSELELARC